MTDSMVPEDIRKKALTVFWKLADHYEATKGAGTPFWSDEATPAIIAQALLDERERLEIVRAQAYQVIGLLLDKCNLFDTDEGTRALDYFAGDECSEDFLPWPIASQASPSKPAQGTPA